MQARLTAPAQGSDSVNMEIQSAAMPSALFFRRLIRMNNSCGAYSVCGVLNSGVTMHKRSFNSP